MTEIPLIEVTSEHAFNVFFSLVTYFGGFSFFVACLCKIVDRS